MRVTCDPARHEVRLECLNAEQGDVCCGAPFVDAVYLCGLSQWVLVEAGVEGVPKYRHAVWNPAPSESSGGAPQPARIEQSAESKAHAERREPRWALSTGTCESRMERRDIARAISQYLAYQGACCQPIAPPNPPSDRLFVGCNPDI